MFFFQHGDLDEPRCFSFNVRPPFESAMAAKLVLSAPFSTLLAQGRSHPGSVQPFFEAVLMPAKSRLPRGHLFCSGY